MTEKKITSRYSLHNAQQIFESISEASNSVYYLFTAKHDQYANGDFHIDVPLDSEAYKNQVYRSMLFGKRVAANDVSYVIKRNEWESGTVYTSYDDTVELTDDNYYTVVNAGAYYHVWKCLYNNKDGESTIEPSVDSLTANDNLYETSDGYQWKYMTSVSSANAMKFGTSNYFPVSANVTTEEAAVPGSIDVIKVESSGNNYNNYLEGNNQFSSQELRVSGNALMYNIGGNSTASSSNDYYNGCFIYIKAGEASEIGQYKQIVDYVVNATSKTIILDSAFGNAISIASVFDIYPGVVLTGTGEETQNVVARAIVNNAGNTINNIEVLVSGAGYTYATANIYAVDDVGVSEASIRPILSPQGGHGANVYSELGARAVEFSVTFSNSESNTILVSNDYRTTGILRDPVFANVELAASSIDGQFLAGETVHKVDPILLGRDGVLNAVSNVFTSSTADFTSQFEAGDYVLFVEGTSRQLSQVTSVTNSTSMVLESNGLFTANSVEFYIPRCSSNAEVIRSNTTFVVVDDLRGQVWPGDEIVGKNSGARIVVDHIERNGVTKDFSTFVATYKYVTTINSGTFEEDEVVYQIAIDNANGLYHSTITEGGDDNIYVTNIRGDLVANRNLRGANSGAIATVLDVCEPEIKFRSGDILYMENINPVTRLPTQRETFQIIFEF